MQLDVVHLYGCADEWCVTVDGTCVVGFAGPDARYRAVQHREELRQLLSTADPRNPDPRSTAKPDPARRAIPES